MKKIQFISYFYFPPTVQIYKRAFFELIFAFLKPDKYRFNAFLNRKASLERQARFQK